MAQILWLAYERPPHPDAVCHPATEADVAFVLECLEAPPEERRRLAEKLRSALHQQRRLPPWSRPCVPCRRPSGLYVLIPWRLALWLAAVLPAADGLIERTHRRLAQWRPQSAPGAVLQAANA